MRRYNADQVAEIKKKVAKSVDSVQTAPIPSDEKSFLLEIYDFLLRAMDDQTLLDGKEQEILSEIREMCEYNCKYSVDNNIENKRVFYSLLLMKSKISVTLDPDCPTASILLDGLGTPIIRVNLIFWMASHYQKSGDSLRECKTGLLTHEIYHYLLEHFSRMLPFGTEIPEINGNAKRQNIAMDTAANQLIYPLNQAGYTIGMSAVCNYHNFSQWLRDDFEDIILEKQEFEYYYRLLKDFGDDGKIDGNSSCDNTQSRKTLVEDHSASVAEQAEKETNSDLAKEMFGESVRRSMHQAGLSPADLGLDLEYKKIIDWKQVLRSFIQRSVKSSLKKTKNRPNRRVGYKAAKRVKNKTTEIDVMLDTSGSMCGIVATLVSELVGLAKEQAEFSFYTVDTDLYFCGKVKSKSDVANLTIKGGGGTNFVEIIPKLESRPGKRPVVFFSDTWGEFPEKAPNFPLRIFSTEPEEHWYKNMPDWARRVCTDISHLVQEKAA